ncbi:MAG: hypothetical protein AAGD05_09165 [Bacteroidota bacterium]
MLGILLIYFIAKAYSDLAAKHERSKWGFAILGIVSYYLGGFIGGIILAIAFELLGMTPIEEMNETALGLLAIPFGVLFCWGLYQWLKHSWTHTDIINQQDILDSELMD